MVPIFVLISGPYFWLNWPIFQKRRKYGNFLRKPRAATMKKLTPCFFTTIEVKGTKMHWVSSFYKQKTLRSNQLHMLLHYILGTRFIFKSLMLSKVKGVGVWPAGGYIRSSEAALYGSNRCNMSRSACAWCVIWLLISRIEKRQNQKSSVSPPILEIESWDSRRR